jgi:hypothetical protein
MPLTSGSRNRFGRTVALSFTLIANLVAAGVPVLHGWAHEADHSDHSAATAAAELDHPHDEVHPLALHQDGLQAHRTSFDAAVALPAAPPELVRQPFDGTPAIHPVAPVPSRAPPRSDQARAPPLV